MTINFKTIDIKELASLVCKTFEDIGLDIVLVGGACVSIYTKNRYLSYDLDFVTHNSRKKIVTALETIGFVYDQKKYFTHAECQYILEFVTPPVAVGNKPITKFNSISGQLGTITLLTPTDCIKDRLAAYYHWNDKQSLEQAIMVATDQPNIDLENIRQWSDEEGMTSKFNDFLSQLG